MYLLDDTYISTDHYLIDVISSYNPVAFWFLSNLYYVHFTPCFDILKKVKVVHSFEPGETSINSRLTNLQTMCNIFSYHKTFNLISVL